MSRVLSVIAIIAVSNGVASAATRTAASASLSDVSAAVTASARGDTVVVPAGSSTWSSSLTLTKGISLIGAGAGNTTLTRGGTLISIQPDSTAIASDEIIRVEGFTFDGNNSALNIVRVDGAGATGPKPFRHVVIGRNKFQNSGTGTSGSGAILVDGQVRGVIYSNEFDRCNVVLKNMGNNVTTEWSNGLFPFAYGSGDNLFFEDNYIHYSSSFGGADPGWVESGQGARQVCRYNNWNMANASQNELWDIHGFQNWPGGQTGTMIVEYYGNTASNCGGYRWINHRGSWGLFFNNIITGTGGMDIDINDYACTAEVPGASGVYKAEVNNTYCFNNTQNGQVENMSVSLARCGVAANQNFWNYNPTFNGTTGIGRGTALPTGNCSVGVGFWVASNPAPTVDRSVIQSGTLYKCITANNWTAYYKPFTYPHPLRSGSADLRPPAPTALRVIGLGATN